MPCRGHFTLGAHPGGFGQIRRNIFVQTCVLDVECDVCPLPQILSGAQEAPQGTPPDPGPVGRICLWALRPLSRPASRRHLPQHVWSETAVKLAGPALRREPLVWDLSGARGPPWPGGRWAEVLVSRPDILGPDAGCCVRPVRWLGLSVLPHRPLKSGRVLAQGACRAVAEGGVGPAGVHCAADGGGGARLPVAPHWEWPEGGTDTIWFLSRAHEQGNQTAQGLRVEAGSVDGGRGPEPGSGPRPPGAMVSRTKQRGPCGRPPVGEAGRPPPVGSGRPEMPPSSR